MTPDDYSKLKAGDAKVAGAWAFMHPMHRNVLDDAFSDPPRGGFARLASRADRARAEGCLTHANEAWKRAVRAAAELEGPIAEQRLSDAAAAAAALDRDPAPEPPLAPSHKRRERAA